MDQDIIIKAQNGDQEAFRSIVEHYKNLVYIICLNAVHDPFEAENLTQETFLQVYQSLSHYEFRGFKTWISRIALHKSIDYKRKQARSKAKEEIHLSEIEYVPDGKMSIQDLFVKKEEEALLKECLLKIPKHYQSVLRKSYEEDKSSREIASEENVSVRTVETRLYRGKKILRERFEELSKP